MKNQRTAINIIVLACLLFQCIPMQSARAAGQQADPVNAPAQEETPPVVARSEETGMVTFIGTEDGSTIPVEGANRPFMLPVDRADLILAQYAPMFGVALKACWEAILMILPFF